MNIYSFSVLCFSYGTLLIAILALIKRRDMLAIRFAIFSLAVCGWGFLFSLWISQNYSPKTLVFLIRLSQCFVVFIPITWIHFTFEFLGKKEPFFKHFYFINYLFALILVLSSPFDFFVKGTHAILEFKYILTPGFLYYVHTIIFFAYVPYGFWHLIQSHGTAVGETKEQIKYLIIGTLLGFFAGGTIYLPFYGIAFPLYLLPLMIVYPIVTGIAMIRFKLFDVEEIANAFQKEKLSAIGTLTASINHEIRNPLYVIQGLAQSEIANIKDSIYLDEKTALKKSLEVHQKTEEQAARAMEIMKRFANFAKQATHEPPVIERVDLNEALEAIFPLVSREFELEKIIFQRKVPKNIPFLRVDRHHLEEILLNLFVNACQAMRKKGGEIRISAARYNGSVNVTVEDNGPGISHEQLKQIFKPFYTTKQEGTGLGLYITKQLVEKNDGKIFVESKVGNGTTFRLEFQAA